MWPAACCPPAMTAEASASLPAQLRALELVDGASPLVRAALATLRAPSGPASLVAPSMSRRLSLSSHVNCPGFVMVRTALLAWTPVT